MLSAGSDAKLRRRYALFSRGAHAQSKEGRTRMPSPITANITAVAPRPVDVFSRSIARLEPDATCGREALALPQHALVGRGGCGA